MTDDERPLSIGEAAAELGLAPSSLRRQAAAGVLRADKIGRDWLVARAEVERYRAEHLGKVGAKAKPKSD